MGDIMIIKCKNMTHAMKAKRLLSDWGIDSSVEKINNDPNINGCVYSILFDDKHYEKAIRIMNRGGVVLHKTENIGYGDEDL